MDELTEDEAVQQIIEAGEEQTRRHGACVLLALTREQATAVSRERLAELRMQYDVNFCERQTGRMIR